MQNETFLLDLLKRISVSGDETESQDWLAETMAPFADEIRRDEIGDVVCVLNPESERRILVTAHADEIGLLVNYITPEGFLHVTSRGGIYPQTYPGQHVTIQTKNGILYGAVAISRELVKKPEMEVSDLLIDIGARDEEDAGKLVELGDVVVLDSPFRRLGNGRFMSRALDDKLGVFIIMEALKRAKERGCKTGVYCAATVGEETGQHGAYFTSTRVLPTEAIVVDVTWVSDCLDTNPAKTGKVLLGGGPVICNTPLIPRRYNEKLYACAKRAGIPVQTESAPSMTSTDADRIHFSNQGVPVMLVSIPLRYMHSPSEVADERDVEGCIALLTEYFMNEGDEDYGTV